MQTNLYTKESIGLLFAKANNSTFLKHNNIFTFKQIFPFLFLIFFTNTAFFLSNTASNFFNDKVEILVNQLAVQKSAFADCITTTASVDIPKTISATVVSTVYSTISIAENGLITAINLNNLNITHSYTDDLIVTLSSPSGTSVILINRSCDSNANIAISLDDAAATAILPYPATNNQTYRPANPLSAFNNETITGDWVLSVEDVFGDNDGGSLDGWELELAYTCTEVCNNFLTNEELDNGTTDWNLYTQPSNTATLSTDNSSQLSGANSALVDINAATGTDWHIQFVQTGKSIEAGKNYNINFQAKAAANRKASVMLQRTGPTYFGYWWREIDLSTTANTYSFDFTVDSTNTGNVGFYFNLGESAENVWIDNLSFAEVCNPQTTCGAIQINNVTVSNCIDHPLMDVATVDVEISWTSAPFNDSIAVQIDNQTEFIAVNNGIASPHTIQFTIPADGSANNNIQASWHKTTGCETTATYNAPTACSTDEIGCDILYICGDDKPYDGDAWDHGWLEYLNAINGSKVLTPVFSKADANGIGLYDPNNTNTALSINFNDYDLIIVSATTEGRLSTDIIDSLAITPVSVLNSNINIYNDLGMTASEASTAWQTNAFVDNTTAENIYNFNNKINPWSSQVFLTGDYHANADVYLWEGAGDQAAGIEGVLFNYTSDDVLPSIASHGNRVFLGYHMNGFYGNDENGGTLPTPSSAWFEPAKHLSLIGKTYFDSALILASVNCAITPTTSCPLTNMYPGFSIDFLNDNTGWLDYNLGNDLELIDNGNGTKTIVGSITNGTPVDFGSGTNGTACGANDGWTMNLTLSDKMDWTTFQAAGGSANVHANCNAQIATLDYWEVSGTLTGTGCNAGRTLTINGPKAPYRLQIGYGGNNGDSACGFGMSTWFDMEENGTAINADIYAFMEETCYSTTNYSSDFCYLISDGAGEGSSVPDTFYTFNHLTGAVTAIGPTGTLNIEAMAYDTVNQIIYTASDDNFGTIDIATGVFTPITTNMGSLNGAEGSNNINELDGMTYDYANNIIWATERLSGTDGLPDDLILKIDPATGIPLANGFGAGIGYLTVNTNEHDLDDIAMAADGTLYAISNYGGSGNQRLGTINTTTGIFTEIGDYGIEDVESLTFTATGQLLATTGEDGNHRNSLYSIDAATAIATFVGSILPAQDVEACVCTFGNFSNLQIGDKVWADLNSDGLQTLGEPGLKDVVVNLLDASGNPILDATNNPRTTTTDVLGVYNFDRLTIGDYIVEFELPTGTSFTNRDVGGDEALDSDANTSTGRSAIISLNNSSINNLDIDAGLLNTNVVERTCADDGQLLVADESGYILRYDQNTGALIDTFIYGLIEPTGMIVGPDDWLYVSDEALHEIRRYSLITGALIDVLATNLNKPYGMTFGTDGMLYVNNRNNDEVLKIDPTTGDVNIFIASKTANLDSNNGGIEFGPDGNLYVASKNTDQILRFDGVTGAFLDTFITANTGTVNAPEDLIFGPDGNLYVTSRYSDQVKRYNGTTGTFIDHFVTYQSGGLQDPADLSFGADGHLYVGSQSNNIGILRYDGTTGAFMDVFANGLTIPNGLLFAPVPNCGIEICDNGIDDDGDGLIDCDDSDCQTLPAVAVSATYKTISDGNWTSASTWQGGNTPPSSTLSGITISVEHNVIVQNTTLLLNGNTQLYITNGSLTFNNGDFLINNGDVYFTNSDLTTANGNNVKIETAQGSLTAMDGTFNLGQNFQNISGKRKLKNICLTVYELIDNTGIDSLINVCATIGSSTSGSFQNKGPGSMHIANTEIKLPNGDFQNQSGASILGSNFKVWVQNGNLQNDGNWSLPITQYCVSSSVTVPQAFLPTSEDCGNIDNNFTPCDCSCGNNTPEICGNNIDDDGDGLIDCDDSDCGPIVNAGADEDICSGFGTTTLMASAVNGDGNYTYSWSNGLGNGATKSVTPISTTTYMVTVTDGNGCSDTDEIIVTVITCVEICDNNIDDDGDCLIDEADTDCAPMGATIYKTIADGNWSNASTWENGNIPDRFLAGESIYINHDVYMNLGDNIEIQSGILNVNGILTMPNQNVALGNSSGILNINYGLLIMNNGNINNTNGTVNFNGWGGVQFCNASYNEDSNSGTYGTGYIYLINSSINNSGNGNFDLGIEWCGDNDSSGNNLPTVENCSNITIPSNCTDKAPFYTYNTCSPTTPEICGNNIDDDGDGLIDNTDSDCPIIEACTCATTNQFENPSFESGAFTGGDEFIPGVQSDYLGWNWGTPTVLDGWSHGALYWVESTNASEGNRMVYINNPAGGAVCQGQYYDIGSGVGALSECASYQVCFDWASFNRENPNGRTTTSQPAIDFTWFDINGNDLGATHQVLGVPVANQDWDNLRWSSISFSFSLTGAYA